MRRVQLRDISTSGHRAVVMLLRRGPGQDQYLDSMEDAFAQADEEQRAHPHPWAVHDVETGALVSFAMISDNIPQPMDEDLIGPYYLWKLLIDEPLQGGATAQPPSTLLCTTSLRDPVLMCSIQAAPTVLARRAASTCGTASLIPVATCGGENVLALDLEPPAVQSQQA